MGRATLGIFSPIINSGWVRAHLDMTQHLARVRIPDLAAEATWRMAMKAHHQEFDRALPVGVPVLAALGAGST